jgi:CubicO group peptidase (beta-lactamase class C family)
MAGASGVEAARALLALAVHQGWFPAAAAEMGDSRGAIWREGFGAIPRGDGFAPAGEATVFDLASLTKPIATTTVLMRLMATGMLDLLEPVASFFPEWRGVDREAATVRDLLEHASGMAARLVDPPPHGRREFEHEICTMPLEYPPRTRAVYSDLGFILLGFLAADRGGAPLDVQFARTVAPVTSPGSLEFGPRRSATDTAPTRPMEDDPRRGGRLTGDVHDVYAHRLGGVAGHSGLFGTVGGVGSFAKAVLSAARGDASLPVPFSPAIVARATTKSAVPGSSRGLGWDTMLPTSSCGAALSAAAFGHVGFTGTSLWIDPVLDRYFVLLTNRVAGTGTLDDIRSVRRAFHDALAVV